MRVIQLLPTLSFGDAVGNDVRAVDTILRQMGYGTKIYAENIDPRLPTGIAESVEKLPELNSEDVILYHGSTGTELNERLPQLGGRKVMIYHNVTPPQFFHEYSPQAEQLTRRGVEGIKSLSDQLDYCVAVSEYNKRDLLKMGFTCPIDVCPILIPFEDYQKEPDQQVMARYQGDGYINFVFVGRIAPNKRQEDCIRAFYHYQKRYNAKARLFLVGSWNGMERYYQRLVDYTRMLDLSDSVVFTGHISFPAILAYYHLADAFLCMSEHEGFCVPLVEAMFFHVPVIAYDAAAVGGTLDGSGCLLETKDPSYVAAVMDRVVRDDTLRTAIIQKQQRRLEEFSYEKVATKLIELLHKAIDTDILKKRPRIIQLSATISRGDAVSNDILAIRDAANAMGYPTGIYSEIAPKGMESEQIDAFSNLPKLTEQDIAIYHHATGTPMAGAFAKLPCKRVLLYHNVTPPSFFSPFSKEIAKACQNGLNDLVKIMPDVHRCIADSEFNKSDLIKMGFTCPIDVCPILIPFKDYEQEPDPSILKKFTDGRTNILFVGRVAPNKKFEDIIAAFSEYQKGDPTARLILVGSYDERDKYYQMLQEQVRNAAVKSVFFTGHIRFSEILAYYRVADAFLCLSEHEGFCVPLVEAMFFDVPIVAYASSAIPETLGGAGVLLSEKKPRTVAEALRSAIQEPEKKTEFIQKQRDRLRSFSYDRVSRLLHEELAALLEDCNER